MKEEKLAKLYEKLSPFLCTVKTYNNIKSYNIFKSGSSVFWNPKNNQGKAHRSGSHVTGATRQLTFNEFIEWYNADRYYLKSKDK